MLYEVIKVEVTGGRVVTGAIAGVLAALKVTEDGDNRGMNEDSKTSGG